MTDIQVVTHSLDEKKPFSELPTDPQSGFSCNYCDQVGFWWGGNPDLYAITAMPAMTMSQALQVGRYSQVEAKPSEYADQIYRSLLSHGTMSPHNMGRNIVIIIHREDSALSAQDITKRLFRDTADRWSITKQLDELKALQPGWYDADSEPYDSEALDLLADQWARWYPSNIERPYIFPTPDSAVRAEWRFGTKEVSLEIELPNFEAYWHWIDLATGISEEKELDLRSAEAQNWVAQAIQQLGYEPAWTP